MLDPANPSIASFSVAAFAAESIPVMPEAAYCAAVKLMLLFEALLSAAVKAAAITADISRAGLDAELVLPAASVCIAEKL